MLHAPGESGTRSLLHLKFSSEAWHQWVGVLKLVRNREWYGGEICWSSYPMLVVKVKKLELAACEYCKIGSTAEVFPLPVKCIRLCLKEQRILPQMLKSFSSSWETICEIFSSGKPFVKSSHHLRTQWTYLIMKGVFLLATCTMNLLMK